MKRRDLIKKLEKIGFVFERHGGRHDIYRRGVDTEEIPRHNEKLAKQFCGNGVYKTMIPLVK